MTKKMQQRAKQWFGVRTGGVRISTPTRKKSTSSPVPLASQVSSFSEAQSTGSSTSSASSIPLVSSEQQPQYHSEGDVETFTPPPVFDTTPVSAADITGPSSELLPLSPKECKEFSQQHLREHFLSVPPPPPPPGPPPQRKSKSRGGGGGGAVSSASSTSTASSRNTTSGVPSPPATPVKGNLSSAPFGLEHHRQHQHRQHHHHHPQQQQQPQQRDDCDNRIAHQPPEVPEDETLTEMALRGSLEVVGPRSPSAPSSSRRNRSWTDAVKALTAREFDDSAIQPESAASAHYEQQTHGQPNAAAVEPSDPALNQTWSESTTSTMTTTVAMNPSLDHHRANPAPPQPPAPVDSPASSTRRPPSGSRASSIATETSSHSSSKPQRGRLFRRSSFAFSESDILKSPAARNSVMEKPRHNNKAAASVSSAPSKLASPSRRTRDQEYEEELRDVVGELGSSRTSSVHPPPEEVQRKLERLRFLRERERRKHNMAMESAMAPGPPRMKTLADLAADSVFAAGDSSEDLIIQMVASAGSAGTEDDDDISNEDDDDNTEYGSKFFGLDDDTDVMTEYTDHPPEVIPPFPAASESPLSTGESPRPPLPPARTLSAPTGAASFSSRIAGGTPTSPAPRTPPHQTSLPNLPTLAADRSHPGMDDSLLARELETPRGYSFRTMNGVVVSKAARGGEFGDYAHSEQPSPNPAEDSSATEEDDTTVSRMMTPEQIASPPRQEPQQRHHQDAQPQQHAQFVKEGHEKELEKDVRFDDADKDEPEVGESTAESDVVVELTPESDVAVEEKVLVVEKEETAEATEDEAGVEVELGQLRFDGNNEGENPGEGSNGPQYQYRSTWMLPNGKPPLPRGGIPMPPQETSPSSTRDLRTPPPHSSPPHARKSLSRSSSPARSSGEPENEREKINPKGPMVLSPSMLRPASRSSSPQRGSERSLGEQSKGGPMVLSPAMLRPSNNRPSLPKVPDKEEKKGPMVLSPAMLRPSNRGRKELNGAEERKGPLVLSPAMLRKSSYRSRAVSANDGNGAVPVFGNPSTFGAASGEDGTGATPRVADRAKAIEGWSAGKKSQTPPPPPLTTSQRNILELQQETPEIRPLSPSVVVRSDSPASESPPAVVQSESPPAVVQSESPPGARQENEEEEVEGAEPEPEPQAESTPPMSPTAMEEWREQAAAEAKSPVHHQVIDWAATEEPTDHLTLVEDGSLTWNEKLDDGTGADSGQDEANMHSSGTLEVVEPEGVGSGSNDDTFESPKFIPPASISDSNEDDTFESPKFIPEGWDEDQLPSDEVWPSHHPMARGHSTRTVQTGNGFVFQRSAWPATVVASDKDSFGEFDDKFFSMDDTFDSGSNAFSAGSSSQASGTDFTPAKSTFSTRRTSTTASPNDVMARGLTPQRLRPPRFDTAAVYREAAVTNSMDVSAWDTSKVMF